MITTEPQDILARNDIILITVNNEHLLMVISIHHPMMLEVLIKAERQLDFSLEAAFDDFASFEIIGSGFENVCQDMLRHRYSRCSKNDAEIGKLICAQESDVPTKAGREYPAVHSW